VKLLTAAGAGNGAAVQIRNLNREKHQLYTLFVYGTFGGATVTLQISPDGPDVTPTTWVDVLDVTITDASAINVEFRANWVRAVVTGGAAQSIDAKLI
jgi:hypothetical protein